MFEYWKKNSVIRFDIKNGAFKRNLSPWVRSRAEKSYQTSRSLRLGQVRFKITLFIKVWYHRDQRSMEQYFTKGREKIIANSSVFRLLKFRFSENWKP